MYHKDRKVGKKLFFISRSVSLFLSMKFGLQVSGDLSIAQLSNWYIFRYINLLYMCLQLNFLKMAGTILMKFLVCIQGGLIMVKIYNSIN